MKFAKYIYNKLKYVNRNSSPIMYNVEKVKKNKVNLQYCNREPNIGDILSPVVVNFCLQKQHIQQSSSKTKHFWVSHQERIPVEQKQIEPDCQKQAIVI